jgi:hypothetical protein
MESLQFLSTMLSTLSVVAATLITLAMTLDGQNPGRRPRNSFERAHRRRAVAAIQGENPMRET